MASIDKIHSNFFTRVFSDVGNVVTFLKVVLPEELQRQLDLSEIALDPTTYVSEEYKPSFEGKYLSAFRHAVDEGCFQ